MSGDFDWSDAGVTSGVGTNVTGCFPWIIGFVVFIVVFVLLCKYVPGVGEFFFGELPGFDNLFS